MEFFFYIDRQLFLFINQGLSNPLFDALLPWVREKWIWAPLYLFVAAFAGINFGAKKGWIIVLGLVLSAGLADYLSSDLIKKNIQRLRPCNDPAFSEQVHLRLPACGSGYSFTSSHAANHFAVSFFIIGVFGWIRRWVMPAALVWASAIALSQVYVGVHYPVDVIGGALLGMIIGTVTAGRLRRFLI